MAEDKFELRDNESIGSNAVRLIAWNWKIVVAVAIGIMIPPLLPVFIGIGIYLILKRM